MAGREVKKAGEKRRRLSLSLLAALLISLSLLLLSNSVCLASATLSSLCTLPYHYIVNTISTLISTLPPPSSRRPVPAPTCHRARLRRDFRGRIVAGGHYSPPLPLYSAFLRSILDLSPHLLPDGGRRWREEVERLTCLPARHNTLASAYVPYVPLPACAALPARTTWKRSAKAYKRLRASTMLCRALPYAACRAPAAWRFCARALRRNRRALLLMAAWRRQAKSSAS